MRGKWGSRSADASIWRQHRWRYLGSRLEQAVAVIGVLLGAVAVPVWAGGADIYVVKLGASKQPEMYVPQQKGSKKNVSKSQWVGIASAGETLWLSCFWEAKPTGYVAYPGGLELGGSITVDGKPLHAQAFLLGSMPDWKDSRAHGTIGPVKWTAGAPGLYSFSCVVDSQNLLGEAADTRDDNRRIESFPVARTVAATDDLTLQFESPAFEERFMYGNGLSIEVAVRPAPQLASLLKQHLVFSPDVQFEVHYLGTDGQTATFVEKVDLRQQPLGFELNRHWIEQRGLAGGRYDINARIASKDIDGPPVSVTFFVDAGQPDPILSASGRQPEADDLRPAAASTRMPALSRSPEAPLPAPSPCSLEVSFYMPEPPVVRANGTDLQAGDQVEISCSFHKERRRLEWPQCDETAKKAMALVRTTQESAPRYSGIVSIDGNTVGVGSSPADGTAFTRSQLWSFKDPGAHEIRCQTDNALRFAARSAPVYLDNGVSVGVGSRNSGGRQLQRFEAATAAPAGVQTVVSNPTPTFADAGIRLHSLAAADVPMSVSPPDAPPNPCSVDVAYYVPGGPIAEAASAAPIVGEPLELRCEFYRKTARVEFQTCDASARSAVERLRAAQQQSGRFTGALHVDGNAIRGVTSPTDGSDFRVEAQWSYREAGQHEIGCFVDNGLRSADAAAVRELARTGLHSIAGGRLKRPGAASSSGAQRLTLSPGPTALAPLPAGSGAKLTQ